MLINSNEKNINNNNYMILSEDKIGNIIEKKSKFISYGFNLNSIDKINLKINEIQKKYFDAKHIVYAYRLIDQNMNIIEKQTDDGEPQQTAGVPILNILRKQNIVNCLIVVVRYFGGILLGTGGLVHCYSSSAKNVIENNLKKAELLYKSSFEIGYKDIKQIKYIFDKHNVKIIDCIYKEKIFYQILLNNIDEFINDININQIDLINFQNHGKMIY